MALVTLISGVCSAVIADEAGEHENRQDGDEIHDPSGAAAAALWRLAVVLSRGPLAVR
jgi:hypothetical protein